MLMLLIKLSMTSDDRGGYRGSSFKNSKVMKGLINPL